MLTRRELIKAGAVTGAATLVPGGLLLGGGRAWAQPVPGGTLDPTTIPKYVTPLYVMPVMPRSASRSDVDNYSIAVRRFTQQILPAGLPRTTIFGYGSTVDGATFHTPGHTIEARVDRPVRATWWNQLVDRAGDFIPHPLTIDPTLHWANPPGGLTDRDTMPMFTSTPPPYQGPVPIVVHLHGGHTFEESDGYPEAWYLPRARNVPAGYASVGSFWDRYRDEAWQRWRVRWEPGSAISQYPNDQRAAMLWYHDHVLGMTRINVMAGMAGVYMLRGGPSDLPAGVLPGPPPGRAGSNVVPYEIPLVIQDRCFNSDGSVFFPSSRGFFGDTPPDGPWIPDTDTPPYWNPEFFANTMLVNGNTWPTLTVEPRRYRFRLLNGCNARTLLLKIVTDPLAARPVTPALPIWVIGTDGGFLPAPVRLSTLWEGPAERLDLIVDFTGLAPGTRLYLINEGPDEPFDDGTVNVDFEPADPGTTGQILRFVVGELRSLDTSVPPDRLALPPVPMPGTATVTRQLSLNELDSAFFPDAPIAARLGTMEPDGTPNPLRWRDPVTEHPATGATEIWEINNFTQDGHPIHLHLVQFQVLERQPFGGTPRPPQSWETGTKDTVLAFPQETTRVKATFDRAGLFVWHCHILDHEDNEMMRPYQVG